MHLQCGVGSNPALCFPVWLVLDYYFITFWKGREQQQHVHDVYIGSPFSCYVLCTLASCRMNGANTHGKA